MLDINKSYVVDKNNKKTAVQVDIKTFEKMEQIIEDYALGQLILDKKGRGKEMDMEEAKEYYSKLKKAD